MQLNLRTPEEAGPTAGPNENADEEVIEASEPDDVADEEVVGDSDPTDDEDVQAAAEAALSGGGNGIPTEILVAVVTSVSAVVVAVLGFLASRRCSAA